MVYRAKN
jgi:hypothetical protein